VTSSPGSTMTTGNILTSWIGSSKHCGRGAVRRRYSGLVCGAHDTVLHAISWLTAAYRVQQCGLPGEKHLAPTLSGDLRRSERYALDVGARGSIPQETVVLPQK
jgi:hypothetical protein